LKKKPKPVNTKKITLFALRLLLGWVFFYAGITKILTPNWSAGGFLQGAKTFHGFYAWLAQASLIPWISLINEWALFLLGVSLLLGICIRLSGWLGALLMLLYYLPGLTFPYIGQHAFLVDEHIIYIACLILLATYHAGNTWGLDSYVKKYLPQQKSGKK